MESLHVVHNILTRPGLHTSVSSSLCVTSLPSANVSVCKHYSKLPFGAVAPTSEITIFLEKARAASLRKSRPVRSQMARFSRPGVLELQVDSSLLDGFIAVLFDLVLLALVHYASQSICASVNIGRVYDRKVSLPLMSPRLFLFQGGLIGHRPAVAFLKVTLTLCALAAILLGFSVNGRDEHTFTEKKVASLIVIREQIQVLDIDMVNSFQVEEGQVAKVPAKVSNELLALRIIDRCQFCEYYSCQYFGYAFDEKLNSSLSSFWDQLKKFRGKCVTKKEFDKDLVSHTYTRRKGHSQVTCDVEELRVNIPDGNLTGSAQVFGKDNCRDLDLFQVRCFRRSGQPDHCAAHGVTREDDRIDKEKKSLLLVFHNASNPKNPSITPSRLIREKPKDKELIARYLDNVAFMSSIDLAAAYKLDLMAIARIEHNVSLLSRDLDKEKVSVSDIHLAVFIPCVFISLLSLFGLAGTAIYFWYKTIYSKDRRYFNSFTSVADILELIPRGREQLNRSRKDPRLTPVVGVLVETMELQVRSQGQSFNEYSHWGYADAMSEMDNEN